MRMKLWMLVMMLALLLGGCEAKNVDNETVDSSELTTETLSLEMVTPSLQETTLPTETEPAEQSVEPEMEAQRILDGVRILIGASNQTQPLSDGRHLTKKYIPQGQTITIESECLFSGIYVKWDKLPGCYSIAWDGGSLGCGLKGFLHDYIRLPEAVSRVTFTFSEEFSGTVCDLEVYTEGRTPAGVQDWQTPCSKADILVFPTHADDDVFFFGPMITYYIVERKLTVQTAFLVDHTGQPERAHERLNGLWELGVRHYPILADAPDAGVGDLTAGLTYYGLYIDIYGWQMEQIRRFQPLVILGHDPKGEYGNQGHKVNAYYLMQTAIDAADPQKHPQSASRYGVWNTPKVYLHLYGENNWLFDVNTVMANDPEGRTPLQVADMALDCHVSQNGIGMHVYQGELPQWDCRPFGMYRTLVGYDSTADVMENICPENWR